MRKAAPGVGSEGGELVPTWEPWKPFTLERRREDLSLFGEGRIKGRHVSDAIKRMKIAVGENVNPIPGEEPFLRPQVGLLWEYALEVMAATGCTVEEALTVALKRQMSVDRQCIQKQVTLVLDDIHGTPDGFALEHSESYKATWRSFRGCDTLQGFIDKFWTWELQEKAYLKMWNSQPEAEPIYSCKWIVLWVCGDYGRPIGPRCEECTVTWTPEEIDDGWQAIVSHCDELDEKERG